MTNNSSNGTSFDLKPKYTDEIDLMEVFFKSLMVCKKYRTLIFVSIAIALASGVALKIFIKPEYKSTIVVNTPNLGSQEVAEIVESIDLQLKDPSFELYGLLKELTIQAADKNGQDDAKNKSYVINATVSDPNRLPKVRDFIVASIENNKYVQRLRQIETARLEETLKGVELEQKRVSDVLNHTIANNLPNENFSVADLAKLKIELMKERAQIKASIQNIRGVSVVKDFQNVMIPDNKQLPLLFGIPLLACLLLVTAYIFYKEISEQLKLYETDIIRTDRITIAPAKPLIKRTSYRQRVRQP